MKTVDIYAKMIYSKDTENKALVINGSACPERQKECSWAPYQLDEPHLMHSFTKGLVAIVKRVTGYNLFQFLQFRIFEPLGISGVCCDTCTSRKDQGGGSRLKTEKEELLENQEILEAEFCEGKT